MRGRILILKVLLLSAAVTPAAAEQFRTALLVDESGSMSTYYHDGTVQRLAGGVQASLAAMGPVDVFGFTTGLRERPGGTSLSCQGSASSTMLDRALREAIGRGYDIIWLVTDNVQDAPGSQEAGATDQFYEVLRGPEVAGVVLFPVLQPSGRGGLVVYGLQVRADPAKRFAGQIDRIGSDVGALSQSLPLRMKPLDREVITIAIAEMDSSATLHVGQRIRKDLKIRFASRLEHLRIAGAYVAPADTPLVFPPQSLFELDVSGAHISPQHVALEPGQYSTTVYAVQIDLGKIRLKKGFSTLWRATFGQTQEHYHLKFRLDLSVPRDSFQLRREILARYGAATLASARSGGRVYALESFPALAGQDTTSIRAEVPLPFDVEVPPWASILVLGSILLGLGMLGGATWLVAQAVGQAGTNWIVGAQDLAGAKPKVAVGKDGRILVDGFLVGRIVHGNEFQADSKCRVAGRTHAAKISAGQTLRLIQPNGKQLDLTFQPPSGAKRPTARYSPTRRSL